MKIIFFLIFFSICIFANAQTNSIKDGLTSEELSCAIKEFKSMIDTDTFIESEKKTKAFTEKIEDAIALNNTPFDSIKNKEFALRFIKNNLNQTKFKSIEEAALCIDEMVSSGDKKMKENKYLYELLSKATPEQFIKINEPYFERLKSAAYGH